MRRKENEQLLSLIDQKGFNSTVDLIGTYCKGNPLYFKLIGDNKYLLFNHYNSKKRQIEGFDCWIATYSNKGDIGVKPAKFEQVKLSFNIETDYDLIKHYLE